MVGAMQRLPSVSCDWLRRQDVVGEPKPEAKPLLSKLHQLDTAEWPGQFFTHVQTV